MLSLRNVSYLGNCKDAKKNFNVKIQTITLTYIVRRLKYNKLNPVASLNFMKQKF